MDNASMFLNELKKDFVSLKCREGMYVNLFGPVDFPISTDNGVTRDMYRWYVWKESERELSFEELFEEIKKDGASSNYDSLLVYGKFETADDTLVRVHSCCFTGDVVFSTRCDCGQQLVTSFNMIKRNGSGAVVYLAKQEGRGIGLYAKAITLKIQDEYDLDTFKSCSVLGLDEEKRKYIGIGVILEYFRNGKGVSVLSNNPEKLNGLVESNMKINNIIALAGFENNDNKKLLYEKAKRANTVKLNI